ncbi:hypothetical protein [Spartinivicinus ruber]|uniref:hypothetical protein n=1 Tax=Spartinivicinus ruber TaxID=2683272 RepID=UPI0013D4206C|nr:hypothetical protein [Spartinivicinus ruber]
MQQLSRQKKIIDRVKVTFPKQLCLGISCWLLLLVGVEQAAANNERLCKLYTEKSQTGLIYFNSVMRDFVGDKLVSYSALIEDLQGKDQYCPLSSEELQKLNSNICKVGEYLYLSHREDLGQQFRFFENEGHFHKIPVTVWLDDIATGYCVYPYKTVYYITSLINPQYQQAQQHLALYQPQDQQQTKTRDLDVSQLTFEPEPVSHFPEIITKAYQKILITVKQAFPDVKLISFADKAGEEETN